MAIDHAEAAQPARAEGRPVVQQQAKKGGWGGIILALLVVAAGGGGIWWYLTHREGKPAAEKGSASGSAESSASEGATQEAITVEVVHPRAGGMERLSTQPGSVHAFEYADLYAKVSGFLKEQSVDIGDTVKKDQVLAVIDDPEIFAAEKQAEAALEAAKSKVEEAREKIAIAQASVATSKAQVKRYESEAAYRRLEFKRYEDLFRGTQSVPQARVDEEREHYEASMAAEAASKTEVLEAEARVKGARADLLAAQSNVDVAKADLDKARVFVEYTRIHSPYDGVVTDRKYHRGSFIRSASDGSTPPLLSVARTDLMRVVTMLPDRDVPYVNRGDAAIVQIDALGGREYKGPDVKVSRFADVENPDDRTMRTEIDVKNTDGKLRDGMYGKATIILEPSSSNLTIPSSSLASGSKGEGAVFVVRDKKVARKPIKVGRDNGIEMEVLSGLTPEDEVVLRPTPAMTDGMAVIANLIAPQKSAPEGHSE